MKFCYNTNSTLPKQCQRSRSVLQDGSKTFELFWKEKTLSYNRRNTVGTPVAELVKHWPTDLADRVRSPLEEKSSQP